MDIFKPKYERSKRALRRMRSVIFDYPSIQEEQAARVLQYLKKRYLRDRRAEKAFAPVGRYSGLTHRELSATGTCETDWF